MDAAQEVVNPFKKQTAPGLVGAARHRSWILPAGLDLAWPAAVGGGRLDRGGPNNLTLPEQGRQDGVTQRLRSPGQAQTAPRAQGPYQQSRALCVD